MKGDPNIISPIVKTSIQKPSSLDVQEGGDHYKDMKIQPLEFIHANKLPFMEGAVVKYICRHKRKNGAEDLKKIIHICQVLLELEYDE